MSKSFGIDTVHDKLGGSFTINFIVFYRCIASIWMNKSFLSLAISLGRVEIHFSFKMRSKDWASKESNHKWIPRNKKTLPVKYMIVSTHK